MPTPQKITATSFREATAEEWAISVETGTKHYLATAGDAALKLLESQKDDPITGFPVNNYTHSLQCATRALRRGESEDFIVATLFHDIGQEIDPLHHDKIAGRILLPFVSEANHWMVEHHQIFQLHFRTHSKFDVNACEKYRGHPHFEHALYFCENYDQNCFDPDYDSLPLATFVPMVKRIFTAVTEKAMAAYMPR